MHLVPAEFTLETAYGSVTPLHRPEDFEALIDQAMGGHAAEVVREMEGRP